MVSIEGRVEDPLPERPADLAAGGVTGMQDSADAVRRLETERRTTRLVAIELHTPVNQLLHQAGTVLDERPDRGLVAETVAGRQGVAPVQRRTVIGAHRGGDAALGVAGVALGGRGLGENEDAAARRQRDRRAQSRDAAADDQKIGVFVHDRWSLDCRRIGVAVERQDASGTPSRQASPAKASPKCRPGECYPNIRFRRVRQTGLAPAPVARHGPRSAHQDPRQSDGPGSPRRRHAFAQLHRDDR